MFSSSKVFILLPSFIVCIILMFSFTFVELWLEDILWMLVSAWWCCCCFWKLVLNGLLVWPMSLDSYDFTETSKTCRPYLNTVEMFFIYSDRSLWQIVVLEHWLYLQCCMWSVLLEVPDKLLQWEKINGNVMACFIYTRGRYFMYNAGEK